MAVLAFALIYYNVCIKRDTVSRLPYEFIYSHKPPEKQNLVQEVFLTTEISKYFILIELFKLNFKFKLRKM